MAIYLNFDITIDYISFNNELFPGKSIVFVSFKIWPVG